MINTPIYSYRVALAHKIKKKEKFSKLATLLGKMQKTVFCNFPKTPIPNFDLFLAENPLTYDLSESKKIRRDSGFYGGENAFLRFWLPCIKLVLQFSRLFLGLE